MQTTYHLSSAQDFNMEILEAIKTVFKSKPITITIEEQKNNKLSKETKKMLDDRLKVYEENPHEVYDFDQLLDELNHEI
jgi:formate dehydrogenase maturation protein FdhE